MKKSILAVFIIILLSAFNIYSQIIVQGNMSTVDMVQNVLAGPGVIISNVTVGTTAQQMGKFINGASTNLGLSSGIVLSTGLVSSIPAGASTTASNTVGGNGDLHLSGKVPGALVTDATYLEFDIIPGGDSLKLKYVFASEEYPAYVCSQYNDVFAFFVSGQNPAGGNYSNYNIARVPGTNLEVGINSINSGIPGGGYTTNDCINRGGSVSNSSLYINNTSSSIVYNGFTVPITASCKVVPNTSYHVKVAIGDVSDGIMDSGVFLKEGSLSSNTFPLQIVDVKSVALGDGFVTIRFNMNVKCNSVTPDDFVLTGPGGNYNISNVVCQECLSGNELLSEYKLSLSQSIMVPGSYTLTHNSTTSYIITAFGTNAGSLSKQFDVSGIQVLTGGISAITGNSAISGGTIASEGSSSVTAKGVCWSEIPYPTIANSKTNDGSGFGSYSSNITGLQPLKTYYFRAYAQNSYGVAYGEMSSFTTTFDLPAISTSSPSSITGTSALGGGNITSDGGLPVTLRGICWSLNANPTVADFKLQLGNGTGAFSGTMTNLSPLTTYHVRAYAVNSSGTYYGNDISFTTPASPATINTSVVNSITTNSAIGGGTVTSDGGSPVTQRGVCWSTSTNPTISNSLTNDGAGVGSYSSNITGLLPGTTYYVKAYAMSAIATVYGNSVSFTTTCSPPVLTTLAVSGITGTTAVGGGNITASEGNVTSRGICWSTNPNPTTANSAVSSGTGAGVFSANMSNLLPNTTYNVRAYAVNCSGTAYGNNEVFTTGSSVAVVTTSTASAVTNNSATCGGNVTSDGGSSVTERGVCWGTASYPTTSNFKLAIGSGTGVFSGSISGLNPGTLYYFRAYAVNANGTSYGSNLSFTTLCDTAVVTTLSISGITGTSASCGGNITVPGGTITARGVCWSTSQNPTTSNSKTNDGSGSGVFSSTITGLIGVTTYYVRAYATNCRGTFYGDQLSFTTSSSYPVLSTATVSNVTTTTANCGGNISSDGGSAVTERGVCWNTSSNPTIANFKTSDGTGTGVFTSSITGLNPGTTYYVRAFATNSIGTTYGGSFTFTTQCISPTVTTNQVTSVTGFSAVCGGNVVIAGGTISAKGVCWSTGMNPTISNSKTNEGSAPGAYSSNITGLAAFTTYYVRAYVTNCAGTAYGDNVSFTTTANIPSISTTSATNILSTSAVSGGNVSSDGGSAVTERGVCWSTATNPTIQNQRTIDGTGIGSFVSNLTGLSPGTTYYYRAYATNSSGTAYGSNLSFSTSAQLPVVITSTIAGITGTTAIGGGNITDPGGTITARGVCWSLNSNPTIADSKTANGTGAGTFTSQITGLQPLTLYHVRAYATNAAGTSYGSDVTFSTTAVNPTDQDCEGAIPLTGLTYHNSTSYSGTGNVPNEINTSISCLATGEKNDVWYIFNINSGGSLGFTITPDSQTDDYDWALFNITNTNCASIYSNSALNSSCNFSSTSGTTGCTSAGTTNSQGGSGTPFNSLVTVTSGQTYVLNVSNFSSTQSGYTLDFSNSTAIVIDGVAPSLTQATVNAQCGETNVTVKFSEKIQCSTVSSSDFAISCPGGAVNSVTAVSSTRCSSGIGNDDTFILTLSQPLTQGGQYSVSIINGSVSDIFGNNSVSSQAVFQFNQCTMASITTSAVSLITGTGAVCGGNISQAGNYPVTSRGVCWSSTSVPTINDNKTIDGSGTGTFISNISGLTYSTSYNVRAYAVTLAGVAYGQTEIFTTGLSIPVVTTSIVTNITASSAVCGGNVTSEGGSPVTEKGICWSTSNNPTIADFRTITTGGLGAFTGNIMGLSPGTVYFVKAYAKNANGVAYGDAIQFVTSFSLPEVLTINAANILATTAESGGEILSDGGCAIITKGLCWGTSSSPDLTGYFSENGSGSSAFNYLITNLNPSTLYYVRAYATNCLGTAYGQEITFSTLSISSGYDLSGVIHYFNSALTAMNEVEVKILDNAIVSGIDTTDAGGAFVINNVLNGNYSCAFTISKTWSGVTATDALKVKRHVAGLEVLSEPVKLTAADVNNTSVVTATDALKIQRRIAGLDASFTRSDWVFEKPTTGGVSVSINNNNVSQNFYALCTGDVNGSNIPSAKNSDSEVLIIEKDVIVCKTGEKVVIPVKVNTSMLFGAMQLFFRVSEGIEVVSVESNDNDNLIYSFENGVLGIVYAGIDGIKPEEDGTLVRINCKALNEERATINVLGYIEFSDIAGNIVSGLSIAIPTGVEISEKYREQNGEEQIALYPNPFENTIRILYNPEISGINELDVFDCLGKAVVTNVTSSNGSYSIDFSGIENGIYFIRIKTASRTYVRKATLKR